MSILTNTPGIAGLIKLIQPKLIAPLPVQSIAYRVSTGVTSASSRVEVPTITEDARSAWVAEGAPITPDEPTFVTIPVVPSKVAGLMPISNESILSANGDLVTWMIDSLVRDLARNIDAAYFGDLPAPAPAGLEAQTAVTTIAGDLETIDVFSKAQVAASKVGELITGFVLAPDDMLTLITAKDSTNSARPLVQPIVTASPGEYTDAVVTVMVGGVPAYSSAAVPTGTGWAIPKRTSVLVTSGEPELETSPHAGFAIDSTYVRATLRVGFAFTRPAALFKLDLA